jgi:hypothetical protein
VPNLARQNTYAIADQTRWYAFIHKHLGLHSTNGTKRRNSWLLQGIGCIVSRYVAYAIVSNADDGFVAIAIALQPILNRVVCVCVCVQVLLKARCSLYFTKRSKPYSKTTSSRKLLPLNHCLWHWPRKRVCALSEHAGIGDCCSPLCLCSSVNASRISANCQWLQVYSMCTDISS